MIVDSETCHIFDLDGNTVTRAITKVAWELAAIDKGKYAHHTLKEIHEQPSIVQKAGTQNLERIEEFCNIVMNSKALFLVGSGTSYHSALIAKHILSKFAKIHAEAIISSEFQYTFDDIDSTSAIIAISQSGETADVLKIKELTYVHTEGIAAGELKHGPLALIDRNSYVLLVNPDDIASEDNIASAYEIKARGAKIIGISVRPNNVYDIFIKIPSVINIYPIIKVLPFQILAYYLALAKNADPDYPRNLAKSVTVK